MASVRFICGTQDLHRSSKQRSATFLGTDDAILYSSCFDANGGLFETLLGEEDAVISDALNHASIIDGIRLCKAQRFRYTNTSTSTNSNAQLKEAAGARASADRDGRRVLDGRGHRRRSRDICDLAEKHGAARHGRRLPRRRLRRRDRPRHTRALRRHGACRHRYRHLGQGARRRIRRLRRGRREIIELLRQRSRPYLFSNSCRPADRGGRP